MACALLLAFRLIEVRTLLDSGLKYFDYFYFLPAITRLPLALAYRLARLRGSWLFRRREESRRHAIASVRRVFPDFTVEQASDVIHRHFQIKSCDEMETFWYGRPVGFLERLIRSEGFDALRRAIQRRDPVLIFSGHFNSVGLFPAFLGMSGITHHFVVRPFEDLHPAHLKFSQRRIRWQEERSGQPSIYTGGTVRPILKALGRAEPVLMLVDVPPSALRRVESVKFFGVPAWFGSGVAALQQQSKARLFFLRNVRDPDWIHQTVSVEEISADPNASARETLQRVVDCIESHIRSHPDHWQAWDSLALFFHPPPGRRYGFKPRKPLGLRDDGQFGESEMAPADPGSVEDEKAGDGLLAAAEIERLPAAAGSVEHASFSEWVLRVEGWMMLPDGVLDTIEVWWNGRNRGAARWMHRGDVAEAYPLLEHSGNSGFQFSWDAPRAEAAAGRIDVIGYRRDQAAARLSTFYRAGLDRTIPAPAPKGGGESAEVFRSSGLKMFTDVFDAVHRSGGWSRIGRLLDWGCGFGRVTAHLMQDPALQGSRPEVCGCDSDDEAIAWCRRHLPTATFESMGADPPTRYPDRCFDLVIGCSTLNELKKTAWPGWLAELQRIVAPGGLVVLSIYGGLAAFQPASGWRRWLRGAPAVADQRARQEREFSKDFEVVEYLERGLNGHEDLIVLRRRNG